MNVLHVALVTCVLVVSACAQQPTAEQRAAGQEEPVRPVVELRGSPRDVAAAREALDGWWTESMKSKDERLQWWRDAQFGCFIHWGVYADPAGEFKGKRSGSYAEHIMRSNTIPLKVYQDEIVARFNPTKYDADGWAQLFHDTGMRYVVITAKHHDGHAMYPSDAYPYDIRDTAFGRDPMRELADACRKRGMRFGFYYSHAFDWEHPDAPGNDWDYDQPGGDKKLHGAEQWYDQHPEMLERAKNYVDKKAIPQLLELIKNYNPDILWFDTSGKLPFSEQIRIVKACREADPDVVINGRAARGVGKNWGDYANTGDNPAEVRPTPGDWETIPTVNNSYGYHRHDKKFKPAEFFVPLIAKAAAKGGNTLLNVGPTGTGEIDPDTTRIFRGIGAWMKVNGESIHGTERTPLDRQAWGDSTLKGETLYLHVFHWPSDGKLVVGGLQSDVASAHLLADTAKSPLKVQRLNDKDVLITLPAKAPDPVNTVIVLKSTGDVKAARGRLLATNVPTNQLLAFDADVQAKSPRYGDGKAARYYVANLQKGDAVVWRTRLNAPATFDVTLRYSTVSQDQTGSYTLTLGDQALAADVKPTKSATDMVDEKLGRVMLPAGEHDIRLEAGEVRGADLMNLFEVNLSLVAP